jgi:hypothetical protein
MSSALCKPPSRALSTALLSPAKEKCGSVDPSNGRGSGTARGFPDFAASSTAGPPGKPRPSSFGALVEGFAGCIVDRGGDAAVAADSLDEEQLAVAAGNEQQQIWEIEVRDSTASARARALRGG